MCLLEAMIKKFACLANQTKDDVSGEHDCTRHALHDGSGATVKNLSQRYTE